jgi:hypothetical protein
MALVFSIDVEPRLIHFRATGALTAGDVFALRELLRRDARFDPSFGTIWDLRAVAEIAISNDVILSLASSPVIAASSPRAFVTKTEAQHQVARVYQIYADGRKLKVEIFTEVEEAVTWCLRILRGDDENSA